MIFPQTRIDDLRWIQWTHRMAWTLVETRNGCTALQLCRILACEYKSNVRMTKSRAETTPCENVDVRIELTANSASQPPV